MRVVASDRDLITALAPLVRVHDDTPDDRKLTSWAIRKLRRMDSYSPRATEILDRYIAEIRALPAGSPRRGLLEIVVMSIQDQRRLREALLPSRRVEAGNP